MNNPEAVIRRFGKMLLTVAAGLVVLYLVVLFYGMCIERKWLAVRTLDLGSSHSLKVVHITDIHYKGDRKYLERVVGTINRLAPDIVCLTGDIVEESGFMDEALSILTGIRCPLYGVPGNHDYWCGYPFENVAAQFRKTGGAWLCDTNIIIRNGSVEITGNTGASSKAVYTESPLITKRILLVHYPSVEFSLAGSRRYDVILAGHTHGAQVRLPYIGSLLGYCVKDDFKMGLFDTAAGPLYINPGIGTFYHDIRLFCRPEITVINL